MAYPTLADLKTWMGVPDGTQDTPLTTANAAAIALIERETRRKFVAAAATRNFRVQDPWVKRNNQVLNTFHEFTALTTLTNGDGVVITGAQYWLWPPEGPPYDQIELVPSAGLVFNDAASTTGRIAVNATWGFSADVPDDLRLAMLELGRALYESSKQGQGGQVVEVAKGFQVIPAGLPQMVYAIVSNYIRAGL